MKRFSWAWATFELCGLVAVWVMVMLGVWPRMALLIVAPAAALGLLVETARYYRTTIR